MDDRKESVFSEWLRDQALRSDSIGNLARDVADETERSDDQEDPTAYRDYLRKRVSAPDSRLALEDAWDEYMDRRNTYSDADDSR